MYSSNVNFLPTTPGNWIALIVMILIVLGIIWRLRIEFAESKKPKHESRTGNADHIDHLPT